MGSCGEMDAHERDAERVETYVVSTVDREQRLIQVISAMRTEIRKLELENMGLRRRARANLQKAATVPIITAERTESVVMTVRRYSVFQALANHRSSQVVNVKSGKLTGKLQR